jgi:hypothetical protein
MLFYYTLYTECMQNMMLSSDAWDSEEFECLVENGKPVKLGQDLLIVAR